MSIKSVTVPSLNVDKGRGRLPASARIERRIVANLIAHLQGRGFNVVAVDDGEERIPCTNTIKGPMEWIFNLDDAWLIVRHREGGRRQHWIRFVLGNGEDVLSDHSLSPADDPDGFNAAMEAFDSDLYV